jgi:hypothetical protein
MPKACVDGLLHIPSYIHAFVYAPSAYHHLMSELSQGFCQPYRRQLLGSARLVRDTVNAAHPTHFLAIVQRQCPKRHCEVVEEKRRSE